MSDERKARITTSFGAVSEDYHTAAGLQRLVAGRLAGRIAGVAESSSVLEVGCGTGFLTQALRRDINAASWVVSDIAEPMVASCRRQLGNPIDALFLAMDAERPALSGNFDLICSNLVFQWIENLGDCLGGLAAMLAPGGSLAFSTLAAGTLKEWRRAHVELGLTPATPGYPDAAALASLLDGKIAVEEEDIVQSYESAHAFVATLKAIGAHTPAPGKRPLPAGTFRRVLRGLDQRGVAMTYRVAYGIYTRGTE